jgi:hypothetical protein
VLRGEERDEFDPRRLGEDLAGEPAAGISPGLVGDQSDPFALERLELIGLQRVDPKLHGPQRHQGEPEGKNGTEDTHAQRGRTKHQNRASARGVSKHAGFRRPAR